MGDDSTPPPTVSTLTALCGSHCGTRDGMTGHCDDCHAGGCKWCHAAAVVKCYPEGFTDDTAHHA